jgi:hypothetical protein
MTCMFARFLAVCFGLTVWSSHAQVGPDQKALQYLSSESHKKLITMIGLVYEQNLYDRKDICPTGYKWDPVSFAIVQPLLFQSAAEHPDVGVWTYRFRFLGCGEPIVYNVIFQGQGGKQPRPAILPPGFTKADPRLMADLMRGIGAAGGLAGVQPDCKNVKILDTKVIVEPFRQEIDGKVSEGVWEEQWVARACAKEFTADFCLTPQVGGGTSWLLGKCRR